MLFLSVVLMLPASSITSLKQIPLFVIVDDPTFSFHWFLYVFLLFLLFYVYQMRIYKSIRRLVRLYLVFVLRHDKYVGSFSETRKVGWFRTGDKIELDILFKRAWVWFLVRAVYFMVFCMYHLWSWLIWKFSVLLCKVFALRLYTLYAFPNGLYFHVVSLIIRLPRKLLIYLTFLSYTISKKLIYFLPNIVQLMQAIWQLFIKAYLFISVFPPVYSNVNKMAFNGSYVLKNDWVGLVSIRQLMYEQQSDLLIISAVLLLVSLIAASVIRARGIKK